MGNKVKPKKSATLKAKTEPINAPYSEPLVYNKQKEAHRINFHILQELGIDLR